MQHGTQVELSNVSHRRLTVKFLGLSTWTTDTLATSPYPQSADKPAPAFPLKIEPGTTVEVFFEIPDDRIAGIWWIDITGKSRNYRKYRLFDVAPKWLYRRDDARRIMRGPMERKIRNRELRRRAHLDAHPPRVTSSHRFGSTRRGPLRASQAALRRWERKAPRWGNAPARGRCRSPGEPQTGLLPVGGPEP